MAGDKIRGGWVLWWFRFRLRWFFLPYLGARVRVDRVSPDFREIQVSMGRWKLNTNPYGAHFGGSLYSMCDPFYGLMLMRCLGREYLVVSQSSTIHFLKPGLTRVKADFLLTEEKINEIRSKAEEGGPVRPTFKVVVTDTGGEKVAEVETMLYVKKKVKG